MNQPVLGIIGGGQLGSMLSEAAKKIDIKTVILSDDPDAPAKNFTNNYFLFFISSLSAIFRLFIPSLIVYSKVPFAPALTAFL